MKTLSQSDVKVLREALEACGKRLGSALVDSFAYQASPMDHATRAMFGIKHAEIRRLANQVGKAIEVLDAQEAAKPQAKCWHCGRDTSLPVGSDVVHHSGTYHTAPQPEKRPEGIMLNEKAEITCEKNPERAEGAWEIAAKIVERCRLFGTSTQAISEATAIITVFRAEVVEECAKVARSRGGLEFETVYGIADAIRSLGKRDA